MLTKFKKKILLNLRLFIKKLIKTKAKKIKKIKKTKRTVSFQFLSPSFRRLVWIGICQKANRKAMEKAQRNPSSYRSINTEHVSKFNSIMMDLQSNTFSYLFFISSFPCVYVCVYLFVCATLLLIAYRAELG